MTPPRRNVEIKTRDADPAATLERALALGATDEGVLAQRDTFFGRARGRLRTDALQRTRSTTSTSRHSPSRRECLWCMPTSRQPQLRTIPALAAFAVKSFPTSFQ